MRKILTLLALAITLLFTACKKDQLKVDEEKSYFEANHVSAGPYDGGWQLTLKPDGVADIAPGGDIIYRGTYKINGSKIKVKSETGAFEFKIISDTELKESKHGIVLRII
jgi:hypothetical protein